MEIIEMKLQPEPFEKMRSGEKTEEYRVNDEKRQRLVIGDYIRFRKQPDLVEVLLTEVVSLKTYSSFQEMFEDAKDLFPHMTTDELVESMHRYYSKDEEDKYGAVRIGVRIVSKEE